MPTESANGRGGETARKAFSRQRFVKVIRAGRLNLQIGRNESDIPRLAVSPFRRFIDSSKANLRTNEPTGKLANGPAG
jgi:hypothetical protein